MMYRSSWSAFVLIAAAGLWLSGCQTDRALSAPPHNVLLISYDTLRADHLGLYGYQRDTSPELDRFGQSAVVFDNAISQSASTYPSHMSLFQSRHASRVVAEAPMLAQILNAAGYATAGFTGGGNVSKSFGFDRGFGVYEEVAHREGLEELMPKFQSWVRDHRDVPFFVFLHTYDVHHPYDPPEPFQSMFLSEYEGEVTGPSTGTWLNKIRRIGAFADFEGEVVLSAEDREKIRALYDGGVRYADGYLKQIFGLLAELSIWDDTIVIFLSDHGEEFWEHGSVLHSFTVFQEVIRVPLIFKLPNQRRGGTRVEQQVRLLDVAPTVLDLLDIPKPETMLGQSLVPAIEGGSNAVVAVSEMERFKSLIEAPLKLIVDSSARELTLFDLSTDPGETTDISKDHVDTTRRLYRQLTTELDSAEFSEVSGIAGELPTDEALVDQLRALGYVE